MSDFKVGSRVRVLDNGQTQAEPRVGQTGKVTGFDNHLLHPGVPFAIVHFVVDNKKELIRVDFLEAA